MKRLVPTCKQVSLAFSNGQKITLAMKAHLVICLFCRVYAKNLKVVSKHCRQVVHKPDDDSALVEKLVEQTKQHLK
jgi:hypothetical protein